MGMPQAAHRYTIDEVLAFPSDGNRYELVHGELLVTPAPAQQHQKIVTRLCASLEAYVAGRHSEAEVFVAPCSHLPSPQGGGRSNPLPPPPRGEWAGGVRLTVMRGLLTRGRSRRS